MMAGLNTVAAAPPGAEAVDLRCLRLFSSNLLVDMDTVIM
jgi:hypothetical protein